MQEARRQSRVKNYDSIFGTDGNCVSVFGFLRKFLYFSNEQERVTVQKRRWNRMHGLITPYLSASVLKPFLTWNISGQICSAPIMFYCTTQKSRHFHESEMFRSSSYLLTTLSTVLKYRHPSIFLIQENNYVQVKFPSTDILYSSLISKVSNPQKKPSDFPPLNRQNIVPLSDSRSSWFRCFENLINVRTDECHRQDPKYMAEQHPNAQFFGYSLRKTAMSIKPTQNVEMGKSTVYVSHITQSHS